MPWLWIDMLLKLDKERISEEVEVNSFFLSSIQTQKQCHSELLIFSSIGTVGIHDVGKKYLMVFV